MTHPLRLIKSYVRREGRMTPGQKQALEQYWSQFGLSIAKGPIVMQEVFHNDHPVVLEIGFGMGHALLALAEHHPEYNFIGIEVHRPGVGKLLAEVHEKQLTNIRVYQEDAVEVLRQCIPDAALQQVLIYFPDPWHKKRHNKRRLIQPAFVALLAQKVATGGQVYLATDWEDYAQHMLTVFNGSDVFKNQNKMGGFIPRPDWRPVTKFEMRGQRLGHGVWDLCYFSKP